MNVKGENSLTMPIWNKRTVFYFSVKTIVHVNSHNKYLYKQTNNSIKANLQRHVLYMEICTLFGKTINKV